MMCDDERNPNDDLEPAREEKKPAQEERDLPVGIDVPVNASRVHSSDFKGLYMHTYRGPAIPGIYFSASGRGHPGQGRITFHNRPYLDSFVPWHELNGVDLSRVSSSFWVYEIKNSTCFDPSFDDGNCEFHLDHDIPNLLSDYRHYVFRFEGETCETIAAGIWFEASDTDLRDQPLTEGHPALPLPDYAPTDQITKREVSCQIRWNPLDQAELINLTRLHPHTLVEYELLGGKPTGADYVLRLLLRNERRTSVLLHLDSLEELAHFDGIATHEDALPHIEMEMDIARTRSRKRKQDSPD